MTHFMHYHDLRNSTADSLTHKEMSVSMQTVRLGGRHSVMWRRIEVTP
jgi:hypothetical protein